MLQINDGLLFLMVYTTVLDCCILLVFGAFLEYLGSRFTFVVFEYIANVSLISVCTAPHYNDIPLLGSKGGWRAFATNNYCFHMATQHSQLTDRKRSRTLIF